VADGAGSAASSEIGSFLAAQTVLERAAQRLRETVPTTERAWQKLLWEATLAARESVTEVADILGTPADELATTLLLAVVTREQVAALQIGDGAAIAQTADRQLVAVTRPPAQEYLNETTFLTSPAFREHAQFVVRPGPIQGLALLTDGLQMIALQMPHGDPHGPFFAPLLRLLGSTTDAGQATDNLRGFLQSPRLQERADDDLTLVLAVRQGGTG